MICPICGKEHDGSEEVCMECQARIDRSVGLIQRAIAVIAERMAFEESGGNVRLYEVIREGVKECV